MEFVSTGYDITVVLADIADDPVPFVLTYATILALGYARVRMSQKP